VNFVFKFFAIIVNPKLFSLTLSKNEDSCADVKPFHYNVDTKLVVRLAINLHWCWRKECFVMVKKHLESEIVGTSS
jgi:hypothetical protein